MAREYIKHPDDVIYYTAPVFFWTNIELSLGVVCACLPTLRPIWFFFYPRASDLKGSSYGYGSAGPNGSKNSHYSNRFSRKPYRDIDELELTLREPSPIPPSEEASATSQRGITKAVTIHQALG